ncbi:c-type cytochrome [Endobacterium cereale]|uniref:c-type cytochrome n=1 Tax=Endobacterium cereale TaxID=2663029 RepID=UPI002B46A943|nr:c-type cytochrome [Endobacterium cereale]MEB2848094.1 c-type cytochrome [Endobacterium cereale]
MSGERLYTLANRWFSTSVALTVIVFLLSAIIGFLIMPYADEDNRFASLWDAICSAAGFPVERSATNVVNPDFRTSKVTFDVAGLKSPEAVSIGRGATLAQQCAICHGPEGISRAGSPNLAGQYAAATYKQLHDFKSGARVNATMTPFAEKMSEQDMLDLAAYYAYLPKIPATSPVGKIPIPQIVASGAPMRGIAPCGSCHGGIERKEGSPWLNGQSAAYIEAQLNAFSTGSRRNDTSQQMRNVARGMTPEEIKAAAGYYGSFQNFQHARGMD